MIEHRSTRGFVLPAAIMTLVLVGVLVTGGFYVARQESRVGMASLRAGTAFYVAERGARDVIARWDPSSFGSMTLWSHQTVVDTVDGGIWSVDVTRMSSRLYFLEATGTTTAGQAVYGSASRTLGMIVRLRTANLELNAALTTVDHLRIGGSAHINGHDSVPAGWEGLCDPAGASVPGVLIDDEDNISYSGKALELEGDPPVAEDPSLTSEELLVFGDMTWDEIVSLADKIYPPGASTITQLGPDSMDTGGSWDCRTTTQNNWGDPLHPSGTCGNYFPLIYAQGNLKIAADDAGQGILLVEGDLEITGGHQFYGPVIIRGKLKTAGTGGHINGGVIAANVDLETTSVFGNALVQYSRCAVSRSVLNNSSLTRVRPLARRSWVDLSALPGG